MKMSIFVDCCSVDARPERIEMYAFSSENALAWTGPKLTTAPQTD